MATPPESKGIRKEEIPEAPVWLEKLLRPLNLFLQQVGQALAGNLTVSQNLAARWVSVEVTEGTLPKPFPVGIGGRPAKGVLLSGVTKPSGAASTDAVTHSWAPTTIRGAGGVYSPAVSITAVNGVSSGTTVVLLFLVLAE